jgi:hypothetical protein
VGQAILDLCGNNEPEQALPRSSGILTSVAYVMPWVAKLLKPMLEKKGAKTKAKIKAEQKRRESDSPDR